MSNQIYYDKYTKYKLKYENLKMQLNNQKGGGDCLHPQLMPPLFTMMYQYMKNKNIKYLTDVDINHFLETKFNKRKLDNYIELCSKLFNDTTYYKIEKIHDRIYPIECKITNETDKNRLLFINFKSYEILNKDHREKFFKIITETSPDYICLTEALVPTKFTDDNLVIRNLNEYRLHDKIEHPMSDSETKFAEFKRSLYMNEKTKRKYTKEDDTNISIDELGNVVLNNVWINFFVDNGYNFIIFGNPTVCPYGKNWGNCIISKKEPKSGNIVQLKSLKKHKKPNDLVNENDIESRCMVHITMDEYGEEHHIICTHLDDSDAVVRTKQTEQIIDYMKELPKGKITLVGDLNAINSSSYTEQELLLLNKLSINGPVPTDAVDKFNKFFEPQVTLNKGQKLSITSSLPTDAVDNFNKFFEPQVTLINKGQKYESAFQKCVSHGYSNTYTHSLLIFTDATTFDHQPLLLLKSSDNKSSDNKSSDNKSSDNKRSSLFGKIKSYVSY
jgi:hypothetical protein